MWPGHRGLSGNYKSFHDVNNKLFDRYQAGKIYLKFCLRSAQHRQLESKNPAKSTQLLKRRELMLIGRTSVVLLPRFCPRLLRIQRNDLPFVHIAFSVGTKAPSVVGEY
jgi:hypothetical protein